MFKQFGITNLESFGVQFSDDELLGFNDNNSSKFFDRFITHIPESSRTISDQTLQEYDYRIVKYWDQITKKHYYSKNIYPLYFQYLSLLFTEYYLDRYFSSRTKLCNDLNDFLNNFNKDLPIEQQIEKFNEKELNTLAYWIATGGGKTLIMHCNILQFQYYLEMTNRKKQFNHIILLTPNEGLSYQHKKDLNHAGIHAELFSKNTGYFFSQPPIIIIDIHKLKEKDGNKTVAVEFFENNNLVLVDEGHRGASGLDWITKRNQLCENGFSFEYSATFGQAIKASKGTFSKTKLSQKYQLTQQYSKCIIFDYSYKFFHADNYGKDYFIMNLSNNWTSDQLQLYLVGCVLSFYQQKKIYKDNEELTKKYLFADPLWVFVGGKVTAKNEFNIDTISDIQVIIKFISRFITNIDESIHFIELFMTQQDDLRDANGNLIFENSFDYINKIGISKKSNKIFDDILKTVFNSNTRSDLNMVYLKGNNDEIGLRVGKTNDWFGIINVGDSSKLINLCKKLNIGHIHISEHIFSSSLFQEIEKPNSSINLLIGAKKFTEGWNSWRVSTMGLMNVGRSEGSEIIQLFGRGVRLKGENFSLKRTTLSKQYPHLRYLEILNVFGIRSNYMAEFEEYLREENIGKKTTKLITLPVIKKLSRNDLNLIRLKSNTKPFKQNKKIYLSKITNNSVRVSLNWYPRIKSIESENKTHVNINWNESSFDNEHLAFLNYDEIFFELVLYKKEKGWHNLQLDKTRIKQIINDSSWYKLFLAKDLFEITNFERIKMYQNIIIMLMKKYLERLYNLQKQKYESAYLEYYKITSEDKNFFNNYEITIDQNEIIWINNINAIKNKIIDGTFKDYYSFKKLKFVDFTQHQYTPLVCFDNNHIIKIMPVPLNKGEQDFVEDLKVFYNTNQKFFSNKKIYLLRNQSKGKGIGFFEAGNFYPDFILWLVINKKQYVCFIDPKGLYYIDGFHDPKIQFYKTVKNIQLRLNDPEIVLESFIISHTNILGIPWSNNHNKEEFNDHHILFQNDDKNTYIKQLFDLILQN